MKRIEALTAVGQAFDHADAVTAEPAGVAAHASLQLVGPSWLPRVYCMCVSA